MTDEPSKSRLVPARPASDAEFSGYMPKLPWRWILIGAMTIATVAAGYRLKERHRADALRAQILRVHEELEQPAERYLAFKSKVEKLVLGTGGREPKKFVDPRLRVSGLRSGRGLYLRIHKEHAKSAKALADGIAATEPDVIGSCLGLAPTSAVGLFTQGDFLKPKWIADARKQTSVMHLRVLDEVLARKLRTELPSLLSLTHSAWLLLVVQQGENRRDHPVDVYLWDLRSSATLMSARVQAKGALMPVRVRLGDAPGAPRLHAEDLVGSGATDCSIAMQIKELAGATIPEVQNVPELSARPLPVAPKPAAPDAANGATPSSAAPPSAAPPSTTSAPR